MIPESFKQDLLNRVDIVEVVSRYVRLKKGGANYSGLCPFHNEKSPSFSVSPAKQFYHCFGCGAHGNAIGFLMAYGGMGYVDAVKDLASAAGMQVPESQPRSPEAARYEVERKEKEASLGELLERAMEFYRAELKKSPRAIEYLKNRGLTGEIAARFRIGYAPDDWTALKAAFPDYEQKGLEEAGLVIANEGKRYDRFRDRVMFPILNTKGSVIGFGGRVMKPEDTPKYLNSPETPLFSKGREVYGLIQAREALRESGRVLVVEGYMDVVALAQFGVGYAVATLGTATTPDHITKLLRLTDELVFSYDGDAAGRKAAWRALETSIPLATDAKPIRFLFLPAEHDPDTYIREYGKDAFEQLVRAAPTLSEFLIAELRAQHDLNTPEGRAGFLISSKGFLEKLAAPALRVQLLREFASLAQVSTDDVKDLLQPSNVPQYRKPSPGKSSSTEVVPLERKLLRYVLVSPALVSDLKLDLLDEHLPETGFLNFIAGRQIPSDASFAFLSEFSSGTNFEAMTSQALIDSETFKLSPEVVSIEFENAYRSLQIARLDREIDALKAKVNSDPQLVRQLGALLQEQSQLKSQRMTPSSL